MTKAKIELVEGDFECVTEYGRYERLHLSGDYGLFQEEEAERINCLLYARGDAMEVSDGSEHEIDGQTYIATVSGWQACQ